MALIDRQAAIDAVNNLTYPSSLVDVKRILVDLPPVQPKRGEWEYHSNPNIGINPEDAYCSCCGLRVNTTGDIDFDEYNFCPRCGAKMEG